ncbi:MAG: hypothetical protein OEX02_03565 [Cyclobacteriaceae bacterium]|nr:hypothetical protein [Cyclobacteriaceae bacterium]
MMNRLFCLLSVLALLIAYSPLQAQGSEPVTYEDIYDEPENINKLFVAFQPIYGELWATNPSVGFGVDATYFLNNVAHFHVHARKAYHDKFEFSRYSALSNSDMQNDIGVLNHFEFGGAYHIKDFVENSETKFILYKKSYRGRRWTARVPLNVVLPCKVRKIYGARLGGLLFDTSTDLNRIIERQDLTFDVLKTAEGLIMPETQLDNAGNPDDVNVFTNIDMKGFYVGASMTWIRNIAIAIDKHEPGVDDQILTAFFDLMITPWITADNVFFNNEEYSVQDIKTIPVGARLGLDGKFNRTLSWGYGGEIGYKPGFKTGGFFALIKISLPVYSTNVNYTVEAFGK